MWKLFQGEKYLREEALIMQVVHNDWFVQFEFKMCQIGLMVSCKKNDIFSAARKMFGPSYILF